MLYHYSLVNRRLQHTYYFILYISPMKTGLLLLLMFIVSITAYAQKRSVNFVFQASAEKITNSLYSGIQFLDSRQDSSSMGFVQKGIMNNYHLVTTDIPLQKQIQDMLDRVIDSTAGSRQLLFQLRHFSFSEVAKPLSEKGYCYFRAILWVINGDKYQLLSRIDTGIVVQGAEASFKLFDKSNELVVSFLKNNLTLTPEPENNSYSLLEVKNIDILEKRKLPVYRVSVYKDGLYRNYESFKNQIPDLEAIFEMDDKQIHKVKVIDSTGKQKDIDRKRIYAVVREGIAYIANEYGYYELKKVKSDFFFIGTSKMSYTAGESFSLWYHYGLVGLMAAREKVGSWQFKLDHLNGAFIPIRQLRTEPEGVRNRLLY